MRSNTHERLSTPARGSWEDFWDGRKVTAAHASCLSLQTGGFHLLLMQLPVPSRKGQVLGVTPAPWERVLRCQR